MRGEVSFLLGGVERRVKMALGMAPDVEDAIGLGILDFVHDVFSFKAKLAHVAAFYRVVLAEHGISYTTREIIDLMVHEDLVEHYKTAARLLDAMLAKPEGVPAGKGGKAKAARPAASP